jgi:UDP-N-acetylglucosamine 4,6-dehydratase
VPTPSLHGQRILVTGGTGTFGHAFTRYALDAGAASVVVFSRGESKQAAMAARFGYDPRLRFCIGDVRDPIRVMDAMRGVEVCVHAAALKRVETCEADPSEAIATNVSGTAHVARACIERGVRRAIFLSTDKAASPHTLYGATKAVAERAWARSNVYAAGTPTRFASTRYGNVLGSTGSVVPLWQAQRDAGTPITMTHAGMTRFWMTIADAVALVALALREMRGGETFVPKCGAAPILDLARAIVETHGTYAPGHVETGLRPGEKMHELLISADEAHQTYDAGTHYVIEPTARTWGTVAPMACPRVADGFTFASDTAQRLTVDELRGML